MLRRKDGGQAMILCLVCRSPNLYTKAENLYVCNDCGNEWEQFTPKVYAVDFDGCLCEDAWPEIGAPRMAVIDYFINLRACGDKLVMNTCREGELLNDAKKWCMLRGLVFDAYNENLPERIAEYGGDCRKISADFYVDDKNLFMEGVNT
jgi:hypothetical protein